MIKLFGIFTEHSFALEEKFPSTLTSSYNLFDLLNQTVVSPKYTYRLGCVALKLDGVEGACFKI
jgi:hypothetical protein